MSDVDRAYGLLLRREEDKRAAEQRLNNERDGRDRPDRVAELRAELDAANRQLDEAQAAYREAQAALPLAQARQREADVAARLDAERAKGKKADKKELKRLEASLLRAEAGVEQALLTYDRAVAARAGPALPTITLLWPPEPWRRPLNAVSLPQPARNVRPLESAEGQKKRRLAAESRTFRATRLLHDGRFSVVYLAVDEADGTEHVIKAGDVNFDVYEELREVQGVVPVGRATKLCAEARVGRRPGYTLPAGTPALVMPVLLSMDEAEKRGLTRRPQLLERWAEQLSATLREAHKRGWLHRDVKPDNVLVDPKTHDAVLADWDLALRVRDVDEQETVAFQFHGTEMYAAQALVNGGCGFDVIYEPAFEWESLIYTMAWLCGERWTAKDARRGRRLRMSDASRKHKPCNIVAAAMFRELGMFLVCQDVGVINSMFGLRVDAGPR